MEPIWIAAAWQALADFTLAGAASAAAVAAFMGLNTWKSQRNGQYELELARRCHTAVSLYVRSLKAARLTYLPHTEADALGKTKVQTKSSSELKELFEVRFRRIDKTVSELEVVEEEALLAWGGEVKALFAALKAKEVDLRNMAQATIEMASKKEEGDNNIWPGFFLAAGFWEKSEDDHFNGSITTCQNELREFLKQKMDMTP